VTAKRLLPTSTTLNINAVNDAPEASVPIGDQVANEGQTFSFVLPVAAFIDIDGGCFNLHCKFSQWFSITELASI
jgi:hypothetical protein